MRALLILLISLSVALAGCADKEEANPTPTPTPTPDDTDPTPDTNTTDPDGNETVPDDNETMPPDDNVTTEPKRKEVVNTTFDYSSGEAAGLEGKTTTFEVPTEFTILTINVTATTTGTTGGLPGTGNLAFNAAFKVLDPDGTEAWSWTPSGGTSESKELTAKAGTWTIKYEGTGNVKVDTIGTAST